MRLTKRRMAIMLLTSGVLLTACGADESKNTSGLDRSIAEETLEGGAGAYTSITQQEAKEIMESSDCIILDVRTAEEYEEGHIPDAICIPNETISGDQGQIISELPDKEQTILVYCRSGRRSKEASEKLAAMGYTDIREFGGIIDWDGEIE